MIKKIIFLAIVSSCSRNVHYIKSSDPIWVYQRFKMINKNTKQMQKKLNKARKQKGGVL
jgi:hypothetical protein